MNQKLQNDAYANAVSEYAQRIAVPPFDRVAIEGRSPRTQRRSAPSWRQYVIAAAATVALIAWSAPAVPALIADIQNAVQLFLEHNGQMVAASDRIVTIDEASRDLPFKVIPPKGVPLAAAPTVHEISVAGDVASAQLFVQYPSNLQTPKGGMTALPALTITETAASAPQANLQVAVHPAGVPPMRPPSGVPLGAMQIHLLTETWIANGTRVTLLGTPGAITQAQLESIRHAMGG